MINILKPGKEIYKACCPICTCIFTYELSDINTGFTGPTVNCPQCGHPYKHSSIFPYKPRKTKSEVENGNKL